MLNPEIFLIAGERVSLKDLEDDGLQFLITTECNPLHHIIARRLTERGQVHFTGNEGLFINNREIYSHLTDMSDDVRPIVNVTDAREILEELKTDKKVAAELRDRRAKEARRIGPTNYKSR